MRDPFDYDDDELEEFGLEDGALGDDGEDDSVEDEFLGFLAGDFAADTDFWIDLFGF